MYLLVMDQKRTKVRVKFCIGCARMRLVGFKYLKGEAAAFGICPLQLRIGAGVEFAFKQQAFFASRKVAGKPHKALAGFFIIEPVYAHLKLLQAFPLLANKDYGVAVAAAPKVRMRPM